MKKYTIKPLQWQGRHPYQDGEFRGEPWFEGGYTARVPGGSYSVFLDRSGYRWSYCFDEYYDEDNLPCKSAEEGKAMAEAHWLDRILPALEEVPDA